MYKLSAILLVLAVSSTNAFATIDDSDIIERTNKVTANLKALNIVGRSCHVDLQVSGVDGVKSKECKKFVANVEPIMVEIKKDCTELNAWYNSKLAIQFGKSDELKMQKIFNACENTGHYDYILPTINLITSLLSMK